jgi:ATP-dependent DNA helicase RecQ
MKQLALNYLREMTGNVNANFHSDQVYSDAVFLLDDAVDSKWTFTVIAALLRQKGAGSVIPIALTSTSNNG